MSGKTIQQKMNEVGVAWESPEEWRAETKKAIEREAIARAILIYDKALASTIVSMWVAANGYFLMSLKDMEMLTGETSV